MKRTEVSPVAPLGRRDAASIRKSLLGMEVSAADMRVDQRWNDLSEKHLFRMNKAGELFAPLLQRNDSVSGDLAW